MIPALELLAEEHRLRICTLLELKGTVENGAHPYSDVRKQWLKMHLLLNRDRGPAPYFRPFIDQKPTAVATSGAGGTVYRDEQVVDVHWARENGSGGRQFRQAEEISMTALQEFAARAWKPKAKVAAIGLKPYQQVVAKQLCLDELRAERGNVVRRWLRRRVSAERLPQHRAAGDASPLR